VLAIRERPVQRYSEVFRLEAEREGFVVEVDFQLTFSFLIVKMEDCRHLFCNAELYKRFSLFDNLSILGSYCRLRNKCLLAIC